MKWQLGRQGTGYFKLRVFSSRLFRVDCWLLKFPKGSSINWHTDPVEPGYTHHRLNIVLQRSYGGLFQMGGDYRGSLKYGRVVYFRPDVVQHRVTEVLEGTRYVLSIGWLRRAK